MKLSWVTGVLGKKSAQWKAQFFPPFDFLFIERLGNIIPAKINKTFKEWDLLGGIASFEIQVKNLIV